MLDHLDRTFVPPLIARVLDDEQYDGGGASRGRAVSCQRGSERRVNGFRKIALGRSSVVENQFPSVCYASM